MKRISWRKPDARLLSAGLHLRLCATARVVLGRRQRHDCENKCAVFARRHTGRAQGRAECGSGSASSEAEGRSKSGSGETGLRGARAGRPQPATAASSSELVLLLSLDSDWCEILYSTNERSI
jgi:hypothetical protein